ncbi:MAG: AraC-like DNA-binding protein [Glaciecola sp.]|jgi:AraC-like DNA-binding protein
MPINLHKTMTSIAVRPLLQLIDSCDIPLGDVLKDTLLNENMLKNDRLPITSFDKLLNNIVRLTKQENIGFITGQKLELQYFSLLGFLLSRCETGRDALVTLRRYYRLLSDSPAPEIFITKDQIKIIYPLTNGDDIAMRVRAELIATGVHSLGLALGGNLYQPIKMGFKHDKPKYFQQLADFFVMDIAYNQPECWISFTVNDIDQPLKHANSGLLNALRVKTDGLLNNDQNLNSISAEVRYILQEWPSQHTACKEAIAELLNTSLRTLTRRLQEENTQFSHLLKDVRMKKAQVKLKSDFIDIQELAHELGFSDRRGFERAFKHWTGSTPSSYNKYWKENFSQSEDT